MRISELSRTTQVSPDRLRRYEAMGLIHSARRHNGYRDYPASVVREVVFIAMAREIGFSLAQIAEVLPRFRTGRLSADEMMGLLQQRIAEIDAWVETQRQLRQKLVDHMAWFENRRRR